MNNNEKTIISRRSRPAKSPLSKEVIIKTALHLLMNEGMSGLSMRKIASALDTGPSSIYVYVKNSQELYAVVLDRGLEGIELPDKQAGNWKERLFKLIKSYMLFLYKYPGLAELSQLTIPIGIHSMNISEYILECLDEGGIHSTAAAWGVDLFQFYATSVAFEQSSRNRMGTNLDSLSTMYQSLKPHEYPLLYKLQKEMISGDENEGRFDWGLEVLLNGLLNQKEKPL